MESFLTSTPLGLSVLGGIMAALFGALAMLFGGSTKSRDGLRLREPVWDWGDRALGLLLYAALMVFVTYAAILVYYIAQGPRWVHLLGLAGSIGAVVLWIAGAVLLFLRVLRLQER